jgi:hypothetical protein
MQLIVTIPLPPKCLRANAKPPSSRGAHIGRNKAIAGARWDAKMATLHALNGSMPPNWKAVQIHAAFDLGPRGRHADPSNLNAWLKATADGIQDSLGIDDANFIWLSPSQRYGKDSRETKVVLTLTAASPQE